MSASTATLNARDAALLAILSDDTSRSAISQALSIALSVTQPNTDVIETFAKTLTQTIRYTPSADGLTVTDERTGLVWQQEGSLKGMSYASAEAYVQSLNAGSFGGFNDWRLPTDNELCSIVDRSRYSPAIDPAFSCKNEWYWTSTALASSSGFAWIVYFSLGLVHYGHRLNLAFVRAVRGASPAGQ